MKKSCVPMWLLPFDDVPSGSTVPISARERTCVPAHGQRSTSFPIRMTLSWSTEVGTRFIAVRSGGMIALISERPSTSHRTGRSSRIRVSFAVSTNRSTMSPSNRMGFRSMRLRSAPIWLPTVGPAAVLDTLEHLVGEAGDQVLGGVHAHVPPRVATVPIDVAFGPHPPPPSHDRVRPHAEPFLAATHLRRCSPLRSDLRGVRDPGPHPPPPSHDRLPSTHGVDLRRPRSQGPVELDAITVHGGHGGIEFPDIARFDARHPEAVRCHVAKGGGG